MEHNFEGLCLETETLISDKQIGIRLLVNFQKFEECFRIPDSANYFAQILSQRKFFKILLRSPQFLLDNPPLIRLIGKFLVLLSEISFIAKRLKQQFAIQLLKSGCPKFLLTSLKLFLNDQEIRTQDILNLNFIVTTVDYYQNLEVQNSQNQKLQFISECTTQLLSGGISSILPRLVNLFCSKDPLLSEKPLLASLGTLRFLLGHAPPSFALRLALSDDSSLVLSLLTLCPVRESPSLRSLSALLLIGLISSSPDIFPLVLRLRRHEELARATSDTLHKSDIPVSWLSGCESQPLPASLCSSLPRQARPSSVLSFLLRPPDNLSLPTLDLSSLPPLHPSTSSISSSSLSQFSSSLRPSESQGRPSRQRARLKAEVSHMFTSLSLPPIPLNKNHSTQCSHIPALPTTQQPLLLSASSPSFLPSSNNSVSSSSSSQSLSSQSLSQKSLLSLPGPHHPRTLLTMSRNRRKRQPSNQPKPQVNPDPSLPPAPSHPSHLSREELQADIAEVTRRAKEIYHTSIAQEASLRLNPSSPAHSPSPVPLPPSPDSPPSESAGLTKRKPVRGFSIMIQGGGKEHKDIVGNRLVEVDQGQLLELRGGEENFMSMCWFATSAPAKVMRGALNEERRRSGNASGMKLAFQGLSQAAFASLRKKINSRMRLGLATLLRDKVYGKKKQHTFKPDARETRSGTGLDSGSVSSMLIDKPESSSLDVLKSRMRVKMRFGLSLCRRETERLRLAKASITHATSEDFLASPFFVPERSRRNSTPSTPIPPPPTLTLTLLSPSPSSNQIIESLSPSPSPQDSVPLHPPPPQKIQGLLPHQMSPIPTHTPQSLLNFRILQQTKMRAGLSLLLRQHFQRTLPNQPENQVQEPLFVLRNVLNIRMRSGLSSRLRTAKFSADSQTSHLHRIQHKILHTSSPITPNQIASNQSHFVVPSPPPSLNPLENKSDPEVAFSVPPILPPTPPALKNFQICQNMKMRFGLSDMIRSHAQSRSLPLQAKSKAQRSLQKLKVLLNSRMRYGLSEGMKGKLPGLMSSQDSHLVRSQSFFFQGDRSSRDDLDAIIQTHENSWLNQFDYKALPDDNCLSERSNIRRLKDVLGAGSMFTSKEAVTRRISIEFLMDVLDNKSHLLPKLQPTIQTPSPLQIIDPTLSLHKFQRLLNARMRFSLSPLMKNHCNLIQLLVSEIPPMTSDNQKQNPFTLKKQQSLTQIARSLSPSDPLPVTSREPFNQPSPNFDPANSLDQLKVILKQRMRNNLSKGMREKQMKFPPDTPEPQQPNWTVPTPLTPHASPSDSPLPTPRYQPPDYGPDGGMGAFRVLLNVRMKYNLSPLLKDHSFRIRDQLTEHDIDPSPSPTPSLSLKIRTLEGLAHHFKKHESLSSLLSKESTSLNLFETPPSDTPLRRLTRVLNLHMRYGLSRHMKKHAQNILQNANLSPQNQNFKRNDSLTSMAEVINHSFSPLDSLSLAWNETDNLPKPTEASLLALRSVLNVRMKYSLSPLMKSHAFRLREVAVTNPRVRVTLEGLVHHLKKHDSISSLLSCDSSRPEQEFTHEIPPNPDLLKLRAILNVRMKYGLSTNMKQHRLHIQTAAASFPQRKANKRILKLRKTLGCLASMLSHSSQTCLPPQTPPSPDPPPNLRNQNNLRMKFGISCLLRSSVASRETSSHHATNPSPLSLSVSEPLYSSSPLNLDGLCLREQEEEGTPSLPDHSNHNMY